VSSTRQPTARLIIIGNEVLSGKVQDANSPFLLRRLRQLGVHCTGLIVVPDEEAVIAEAIREASGNVDWVFTTGGVGPTHDDVTMKSVALAFGLPLEEHPEVAAFLRSHPKHGDSPERLRMAQLPAGAEVDLSGPFPQVRVGNVWVFPGVPKLLKSKFELVAPQLGGIPMYCSGIYCTLRESAIALRLEAVVAAWPGVEIGSYPQWLDTGYRVLITLESLDPGALGHARTQLLESLEPEVVIEVVEDYRPEDEPR
jgi:molybdenum cofactor synthesis domain-containing protein